MSPICRWDDRKKKSGSIDMSEDRLELGGSSPMRKMRVKDKKEDWARAWKLDWIDDETNLSLG